MRKHRLSLFIALLAMLLLFGTASALAGGELQHANVDLYIEGEFPQPSIATYSLKARSFDAYMREQLEAQAAQIDVSEFGMTSDELYTAFQNLLNHAPALFYVSGGYSYYTDYSTGTISSILPTYRFSGTELTERVEMFETELNKVVSYAQQSSTVIGQLLRANDYLCANYAYDTSYSIYTPDQFFEYGSGVCQAYTMAFGAVLDELGIPWTVAESNAMNHIWNMVNVGEDWYHIDTTWNDPLTGNADVPMRVFHNNFLCSDSGIEASGHYSWVQNAVASNTQYDDAFWTYVAQAFPMVGDTAYYAVTVSGRENVAYKVDLATLKETEIYQYSTTLPFYYSSPIWVAGSNLYYADRSKLYSVPLSGGTATVAFTAGNGSDISEFFQTGTKLKIRAGSDIYTITVTSNTTQKAKITKQPVSVTVAEGATAKVSVTATGDGLTYKWYYKDAGASGFAYTSSFTGSSYSVTMNASCAGRQVYCVVTDKYGNSVKSSTATLGMIAPVKITKQPTSVTVASGETARVSFTATGDGLTYKWYYKNQGASNFSTTSSFTGNSYSLTMTSARAGRQVYCVVTDKYGNTAKTNTVTLDMTATAGVQITKQPASVTVASGETAKVSFTATGDGLTYKWYYKNQGASKFSATSSFTGNTYSLTMTSARAGRQVYCVVTDKYGNTAKTNTVTLNMTVSAGVKITKQPVSVSAAAGATAKVSFTATGDGLTYKWYYKNKNASKFSTTSTFTGNSYSAVMNATRAGRQVYCVVTDKYGNKVQTNTVTLNMTGGVTITKQPTSVTVANGATAKVSFTASGEGLTYKWYYKNRNATKFSTTSTFTGNSYSAVMNTTRAGRQVYCVVKDKYGNTAKTSTVTLNMKSSVKITKQPTSVTVAKGATAKVSVTATGEGLTYKWYYKNRGSSKFSVSTSTGSTYSAVINTTRAGRQVYCVVKDKYGNTAKSNTVTLNMAGSVTQAFLTDVQYVVTDCPYVKLQVTSDGLGLKYAWYCKNEDFASYRRVAITSTNVFDMLLSNNGCQIYCVVTDKYGISVKTNTIAAAINFAAQNTPITALDIGAFTDSDITPALKNAGFGTAKAVESAMGLRMHKAASSLSGMKLYDVTLEYSMDDGKTWKPAGAEHFPENGRIVVTMPVPQGTDPSECTYLAAHMVDSDAFGKEPGSIEMPAVKVVYGADGKPQLSFEVTGLSPVMIGWIAKTPAAVVPQTGDDMNLALCVTGTIISLLGGLMIVGMKRKRA